jgi:hypothetical protein
VAGEGTGFAVLATGEHYLADIIVAIPYSLMVLVYCSHAGIAGRDYTLAVSAVWSPSGF